MSTLKVNAISDAAGANGNAVTLATDGTCTAKVTNNLSHRNLIINGSMAVNQRGTVTGVVNSSYGGPDRWKAFRADAPGIWQLSQQESAPNGSGFSHCLEHKVTTANGTLDAGDEACITYSFEGQDLTQVKKGTSSAEQLTLSFWCRTNLAGTYIAELYDTDNNRQCSKSFTHSGSDAWEKETITFPADTTGAFTADTNESLALRIWVAAGTTWTSGTLNTTWAAASNANRAVGCTNLSATLNNYFRLTGVQLEVGDFASDFCHEPEQVTFTKCQRYFQYWYNGVRFPSTSSNNHAIYHFPTPMRAAPTVVRTGDQCGSYESGSTTALMVGNSQYKYYYSGLLSYGNSGDSGVGGYGTLSSEL
jgi:hypothetical protein